MFIALDSKGKRVEALNAERGEKYQCPSCGNPVILRSGLHNADHFSHIANECSDTWTYDMSEWHVRMQSFFPVDTREVVVKHNGAIHRADILTGNTVFEFQHSPMSAEEFNDRNEFFSKLGFRIVWVFDVRDRMTNDQIQFLNNETSTKFKWSHPMRLFKVLSRRLSDYDKQFAIYLDLFDEEDADDAPYIYRIVWTKANADDAVDLSRFAICDDGINMAKVNSSDKFFQPLKEKRELVAREMCRNLKCESIEKGFSYSIKYIGEDGKPKSAYTCMKRNEFGLKMSGETACVYCKYCAMTIRTNEDGKSKLAIYCCYPYIYRAPIENAHPGYEYYCVDELTI